MAYTPTNPLPGRGAGLDLERARLLTFWARRGMATTFIASCLLGLLVGWFRPAWREPCVELPHLPSDGRESPAGRKVFSRNNLQSTASFPLLQNSEFW